MIKGVFIFFSCLLMYEGVVAQPYSTHEVIEKVVGALQHKDVAALQTHLADNCSMAGLDPATTKVVLKQVVSSFSKLETYTIESEAKEIGGTRLHLKFNYTDGKSGYPILLLNVQNQIVELNIIKSPHITQTGDTSFPVELSLPFHLLKGCIYVEGSINGLKGLFMVDSGAFGLVMNKDLFSTTIDTVNYGSGISGVNGEVAEASTVNVDDLVVGKISLHHLKAISIPMEKEVGETGLPNLGLLGYSLLSHYAITYDYKKQILQMNKVDSLGVEQVKDTINYIGQFHFDMQRHLPLISAMINGDIYRFALDCGASHNLIYRDFDHNWEKIISDKELKTLSGIDGKVRTVITGNLNRLMLGSMQFSHMATAFTPNNLYTQSDDGKLKIDGIMGFPFFSTYKIKVNYQKRELYFFD